MNNIDPSHLFIHYRQKNNNSSQAEKTIIQLFYFLQTLAFDVGVQVVLLYVQEKAFFKALI